MAQVEDVAQIIRDAGGRIAGRTRLQKMAYLLEIAGLGHGFGFDYRRFGPYSDELSRCARDAVLLHLINEQENQTSWGGTYSVYTTREGARHDAPRARRELAEIANASDPIELELAATAAFLFLDGHSDAWSEVARRKPEKSAPVRIEKARELYRRLREVPTPDRLPEIA